MPAVINTTGFSNFVRNAEIKWRKAFDQFPKVAAQIYDIEYVGMINGEESSQDGFTVARKKREGQDFKYLQITQAYSKTWSIYEIGGETKITWKMRVGAKYREIDKRISGLAQSAAKRMEWDLTHRLTFAYATSYTDLDGDTVTTTTGDGYALCYTAHTVPGSSTTYSNNVSGNPPLSKASLEAAEKLYATQMLDDNGETLTLEPDTIIVPNDPTLINTAREYLKSTAAPDSANSGIYNTYMGKYSLLVLPYLATTAAGVYDSAKAGYWFLASLKNTDAMLKILEAPTFIPPTENDGKEFSTQDWCFATHGAMAIEILRPHWIVGSKGDST